MNQISFFFMFAMKNFKKTLQKVRDLDQILMEKMIKFG